MAGKTLSRVLLVLLFTSLCHAQTTVHYEPTLASLNSHPLPQWYADAKLGIFVHWGFVFRAWVGSVIAPRARLSQHRLHQEQSVRGVVLQRDAHRRLTHPGLSSRTLRRQL